MWRLAPLDPPKSFKKMSKAHFPHRAWKYESIGGLVEGVSEILAKTEQYQLKYSQDMPSTVALALMASLPVSYKHFIRCLKKRY